MPSTGVKNVFPKVSTVATFPPGYFLENIVAIPDGSLLVTDLARKALYCIPPAAEPSQARTSFTIHQFGDGDWATGLAIAPHDSSIVYILTTDFLSLGSQTHRIWLLDLQNASSGAHPTVLAEFPAGTKALNGLTAINESVLLAADSFAGVIWKIQLDLKDCRVPRSVSISEWWRDPILDGVLNLPDFQPGANGIKYSKTAQVICFTNTQKKVLCKIEVDAQTLLPIGDCKIIHRGAQGDDLIIDDDTVSGPTVYLTTHRDNSIVRVPISDHTTSQQASKVVVEGTPEDPVLLGPTSGAWEWDAMGKIAYFACDGGIKSPLPGEGPRFARVVKVEF